MQRQLKLLLIASMLSVPFGGAALAQAGDPARPQERVLSVVGEGIVRGRPDMAIVTVGVVSESASAREALSANTQAMTTILAALKAEGIESRDLQTSGFSVEPRQSQPPRDWNGSDPFEQKIVGYTVRNNITLRIRRLETVGAFLDRVISLGANSITGPTFSVADPSTLEDQARRAAIRDAVRKAQLYAAAAGTPLGPITRIEESLAQWPQPAPAGAMARQEMMADAAPPPIEGGELSFRAQVSVVWRLADEASRP